MVRPLFEIRPAREDEYPALSALARRSKGHWGYSDAFMEACREELTLRPGRPASDPIIVMEVARRVVGFYGLERIDAATVELDYLFVEPDSIGLGFGRTLIQHAKSMALGQSATRLVIQGDANAERFYRAAGGVCVGTRPSDSIEGRELPLFEIALG